MRAVETLGCANAHNPCGVVLLGHGHDSHGLSAMAREFGSFPCVCVCERFAIVFSSAHTFGRCSTASAAPWPAGTILASRPRPTRGLQLCGLPCTPACRKPRVYTAGILALFCLFGRLCCWAETFHFASSRLQHFCNFLLSSVFFSVCVACIRTVIQETGCIALGFFGLGGDAFEIEANGLVESLRVLGLGWCARCCKEVYNVTKTVALLALVTRELKERAMWLSSVVNGKTVAARCPCREPASHPVCTTGSSNCAVYIAVPRVRLPVPVNGTTNDRASQAVCILSAVCYAV